MALRSQFLAALKLLRDRPVLFLPRIITSIIWSFFWIVLIRGIQNPAAIDPHRMSQILLFFAAFIPIQTAVFNAYFLYIRQYHAGEADIWAAIRTGVRKVPPALGVYLGTSILIGFGMVPGGIIALYGVQTGNTVLMIIGGVLAVSLLIAILFVLYFSPIAVVIGNDTFAQNLRDGIAASRNGKRTVAVLMTVSFGLLLVTSAVQGAVQTLGVIGFVLGRIIASVFGVYLLVVNPELFMTLKDKT